MQTRYGLLRAPDTGSDIISDFLAAFGEWAWLETTFLARIMPPRGSVLDGGAYLGTFTLGLAQQRAIEKACLVEANPDIVPLLRENLDRCGCMDHAVVPAMLAPPCLGAGRPGRFSAGNLGSASFLPQPDDSAASAADRRETSPCLAATSIADLSRQRGPFDLIKLDLEGMELALVRSEHDFLASSGAALWVECNEAPAALELAAALLRLGRTLWYFAFPAFNPTNFNGAVEPLFPFAYESGLLVMPPGGRQIRLSDVPDACILWPITSPDHLRRALWLTPRHAPPGWDRRSREELVALAGRMMLGEQFEDFLERTRSPEWTSPVARAEQQVANLRSELACVRASRSGLCDSTADA